MLIVESIEVSTFSFIGELWRIADHISISVVPTVVVVSTKSFFVINSMNENLVFTSVFFKVR